MSRTIAKTKLRRSNQGDRQTKPTFFLQSETLEWIEQRTHLTEDELALEFPQYREWKYGRLGITHEEIDQLAKFTYESSSCFLRHPPFRDEPSVLDFRNSEGVGVERSRIDLVPSLRQRLFFSVIQREWMHDYADFYGGRKLGWVGSFGVEDSVLFAAKVLGELLPVSREGVGSSSELLPMMLREAEMSGVLVQSDNVVDRRSVRPLDMGDFNCFQILDEFAPLVFLHSDASDDIQVFSLVHALAHLLVGEAGVVMARVEGLFDLGGVVRWCSLVALEWLVPEREVVDLFDADSDLDRQVEGMAGRFWVSPLVVLVRLKQLGLVEQNTFLERKPEYCDRHYDLERTKHRFFQREPHLRRVGETFANAVATELYRQEIDIKEACSMLDTPYDVFDSYYYITERELRRPGLHPRIISIETP